MHRRASRALSRRSARKRKRLHFEADMLFQGAHDHVVITVLQVALTAD